MYWLKSAVTQEHCNWAYVNGILSSRKSSGVRNMADVAREDEAFRERKSSNRKRAAPNNSAPVTPSAPSPHELEQMKKLLDKIRGDETSDNAVNA